MKQSLSYPIKLYISKTRKFLYSIFLLCTLVALYYGATTTNSLIYYTVGILCLFCLPFFLMFLLNNRPFLTIKKDRIEIFYYFKSNKKVTYLWHDIRSVELHEVNRRNVKAWNLAINFKDGKIIRRPLVSMQCENAKLNEKEIFHLIEQSFNNQYPIIIKNNPISFKERTEFNYKYFGFLLIVALAGFIYAYLV